MSEPFALHLGDCIEVMRGMADNSVDAIVTDPPYHLTTGKKGGNGPASVNLNSPAGRARVNTGFMGQQWDGGDIAQRVELWAECLRVLKPGGYLLAFSSTRTQHRMVCAIEDAGFEVRDRTLDLCGPDTKYGALWDSLNDEQRGMLAELLNDQLGLGSEMAWTFGSGFPKSLDVSKALDKAAGAERGPLGAEGRKISNSGDFGMKNRCVSCGKPFFSANHCDCPKPEAVTDVARQWDGWGTALKPAHEPICVARKPLIGTVAANVLAWGTGALNIDGCRIGYEDDCRLLKGGSYGGNRDGAAGESMFGTGGSAVSYGSNPPALGRWPANVIHDGSAEVVSLFPGEAGARAPVPTRNGDKSRNAFNPFAGNVDEAGSTFQGDFGSAARFYYCAKASRRDRNEGCEALVKQPLLWSAGTQNPGSFQAAGTDRSSENFHPTVKPTSLMQFLVRLVTPPGGVVLDPFAGSGSTGKACMREGFQFVGIELNPDYLRIAEARIRHALAAHEAARPAVSPQIELFETA